MQNLLTDLVGSAGQGKAGKGVKGQGIIKKKPQQFWHMILHNKLWCIQIAPVEQLKCAHTNKLANTSIHCVYATQLFKARTKTINELSQTMPGQPTMAARTKLSSNLKEEEGGEKKREKDYFWLFCVPRNKFVDFSHCLLEITLKLTNALSVAGAKEKCERQQEKENKRGTGMGGRGIEG